MRRSGAAGNERGRQREAMVQRALELLCRWGSIAGYLMSAPGDDEDRTGVDARMFTMDQRSISFQIKGSYTGVQTHRKKYPHISCVDVSRCTYVADVAVMIQQQFDLPERPPNFEDDNAQP